MLPTVTCEETPHRRLVRRRGGARWAWPLAALLVVVGLGSPAALADKAPDDAELSYYLPKDVKYDPKVPTPQSYLGYEIGNRHLHHHELVGYLQTLAKASPRVKVQEYARSHGKRPLLLLTITSPDNHGRLETIRKEHLRWINPKGGDKADAKPPQDMPAILNMGYGIHGNEPSASSAAVVVAYHLAAAQGEQIDKLLADVVILMDPCLNPDGFDRFAHWANSHRGQVPNADRDHREHQEPFPNGRTNYYWFDLNRDWMPLTQPESRGRMEWYHRWMPNVVLDYHEMGTDSTYFFQPGVPTRRNPWIPERNVELTVAFGDYHAKALDQIGSEYFTEAQFDDFYPGKGSTYPDLHGGVGILFEQGSSRGHVQESINGDVTFPFTIRNQVTTSLSSLQATLDLREELLVHQRNFYRENLELAAKDPIQAYVVASPGDPHRLATFLDLLRRQRLTYVPLDKPIKTAEGEFKPGEAFVVPMRQKDYRFLKAIFERRTKFTESIFYDISTWTMLDAYGLQYSPLKQWPVTDKADAKKDEAKKDNSGSQEKAKAADQKNAKQDAKADAEKAKQPKPAKSAQAKGQNGKPAGKAQVAMPKPPAFRGDETACLIDWRGYFAPQLLYQLQQRGYTVKVATEPIVVESNGQRVELGYGTLVVPLGKHRENLGELQELLRDAAALGVASYAVKGGLTAQGPDLGSGPFRVTKQVKPLLIVGEGVTAYDAGEVWHLLDQRFKIPVTLAEVHRIGSMNLSEYTTVIVVEGSYRLLGEAGVRRLKAWVEDGGTLIAIGSLGRWLKDSDLANVTMIPAPAPSDKEANKRRPYASAADDAALKRIRGAILQGDVDITHPLGYGYADRPLALFRSTEQFVKPTANPYSSPVVYREKPLVSGYMSEENQKRASEAASVAVYAKGRGRVVLFTDNPVFRAHWHGTERLFLNALSFGDIIRVP